MYDVTVAELEAKFSMECALCEWQHRKAETVWLSVLYASARANTAGSCMSKARKLWSTNAIAQSVDALQYHAQLREINRTLQAEASLSWLSTHLNRWRTWVSIRIDRQSKLEPIIANHRLELLKAALQLWPLVCKNDQMVTMAIQLVQPIRAIQLTKLGWKHWSNWAHDQAAATLADLMAIDRWRHFMVGTAVYGWLRYVQQCRLQAYAFVRHVRWLVKSCLIKWRETLIAEQEEYISLIQGIDHWDVLEVMRTLIRWGLYCTASRNNDSQRSSAIRLWSARAVSASVRGWKNQVIEQGISDLAEITGSQQHQRKALQESMRVSCTFTVSLIRALLLIICLYLYQSAL